MSASPFIDHMTAAYQAAAAALPGGGEAGIASRRAAALEAFRRHGLPGQKLEAWKFTSLRGVERQSWPLPANDIGGIAADRLADAALAAGDSYRLVFVNGRFDAAASRLSGLPAGAVLRPLSASGSGVADILGDAVESRETALAALNAAFASDGVALDLADGVVLDRPVEIIAFGVPAMVNLRHRIRLGRKASAMLIESYRDGGAVDAGWSNIVLAADLAEGAQLIHIRLQAESVAAYHAGLSRVRVGRAARYAHVSVQAGGAVARHELHVETAGSDAEIDIQGLVLARGASHIDHTLKLHHALPHCRSNQLFKHVVGDTAHAVFQGGIRVAPDAQKTDAQQLSRTLLLADRAQIDTKPELEILADDVKCSHGASIGDVDPQQLFYMRARGMSNAEARRLLLSGFAFEIVAAVPDAGGLRAHVEAFVEGWLAQGATA